MFFHAFPPVCVSRLGQVLQTEMRWLARHSMQHLLILKGRTISLSDEWELKF